MRIREYYKPDDLNAAYEKLVSSKGAVLMAGGMFLRLQKRHFQVMIDLSGIGLGGIIEKEGCIEIGAMVSLRELEKSGVIPEALREAMCHIGGVSLRNMATVGGSIMGKYPFSDVITPLLTLDATLHFHTIGEMSLAAFMASERIKQDILTKITFHKPMSSAFKTFKTVYVDFSLLNIAVVKQHAESYRVGIGARPGVAKHIVLNTLDDLMSVIDAFEFGDNIRASGAFRRAIALAFLEDLKEEEPLWK